MLFSNPDIVCCGRGEIIAAAGKDFAVTFEETHSQKYPASTVTR